VGAHRPPPLPARSDHRHDASPDRLGQRGPGVNDLSQVGGRIRGRALPKGCRGAGGQTQSLIMPSVCDDRGTVLKAVPPRLRTRSRLRRGPVHRRGRGDVLRPRASSEPPRVERAQREAKPPAGSSRPVGTAVAMVWPRIVAVRPAPGPRDRPVAWSPGESSGGRGIPSGDRHVPGTQSQRAADDRREARPSRRERSGSGFPRGGRRSPESRRARPSVGIGPWGLSVPLPGQSSPG
jgi:hypothetical protein